MIRKFGSNTLLEKGFFLLAAGIALATLGSVAAVALPGLIFAGTTVLIFTTFLGSVVLPFVVR